MISKYICIRSWQKSQNWSHCETLESNPILKWNNKALIHSNTQVLAILKNVEIVENTYFAKGTRWRRWSFGCLLKFIREHAWRISQCGLTCLNAPNFLLFLHVFELFMYQKEYLWPCRGSWISYFWGTLYVLCAFYLSSAAPVKGGIASLRMATYSFIILDFAAWTLWTLVSYLVANYIIFYLAPATSPRIWLLAFLDSWKRTVKYAFEFRLLFIWFDSIIL